MRSTRTVFDTPDADCSCPPLNSHERDAAYRLLSPDGAVTFCRRCQSWRAEIGGAEQRGRGLAGFQRLIDVTLGVGSDADFLRTLGGYESEFAEPTYSLGRKRWRTTR